VTDSPAPRSDDSSPVAAVGFAVAVTALGAQPIWMLSAYAPSVEAELGFDEVAFGFAVGIFFAVSTLVGLRMGRLVQQWQWRRSVALTAAVTGLCFVLLSTLANGFVALVVILCVGAIANSASQPAGNLAIASSVHDGRQGMAFGIKQAALPISTLLVGLSVPLFGDGEQWRLAFATTGMLAFAVAFIAVRRHAATWRLERATRRASAVTSASASTRRIVWGPGVPVPRPLIFLAVGASVGTAVTISVGGFLVLYATSQGFSAVTAGQLLALGSAVGVASRLTIGYFSDRWVSGHVGVVAIMMAGGAVGLVLLAVAGTTIAGLVIGVLLAFGLGWSWNGLFHFCVVRYSGIPAALATSVVWTSMSLGSAIGPIVFGFLAAESYSLAWLAAAGAMLVAASFIGLAHREYSRA
jgi:MFS family permease